MRPIYKYPRTHHIEGSGLQQGDDAQSTASFRQFANQHLVVEEKMDGANSAISFDSDRNLLLQSRGHYLTGGPREQQFHLFKTWASRYTYELWELLADRYVMYGEWLYAKHTVFYTDLPHYFLEFDIYDITTNTFLSTARRQELLQSAPFITSVRVLHEGTVASLSALQAMIGPSAFIADNQMEQLHEVCREHRLDPMQVQHETDNCQLMEGLYIKVETSTVVTERYKYIRAGFLQTVFDSQSHWMDRPLLPNRLRDDINLFT